MKQEEKSLKLQGRRTGEDSKCQTCGSSKGRKAKSVCGKINLPPHGKENFTYR